MFISQRKYFESVLKHSGMENCKPISTPLEYSKHFIKLSEHQETFDKETCQQAIACLTYLSTVTRPDIAASGGLLSRLMSNQSKDHWTGINRIFRYLNGTLNYGLKFTDNTNGTQAIGFADSDWTGDINSRCLTSGCVFQIANCTVSWPSKNKATVAKS